MGAPDLLTRVLADGLILKVRGDKLIVTGPADARDRWRDSIRHAKPELLEVLSKGGEDWCSRCRHRSIWGNCLQPVEAGLAKTFGLVRHAEGGAGCAVFEPADAHAEELGVRLERLLAMGAIDQSDAELARLRHREDPAAWDCLLNACEAAMSRRTEGGGNL